jgi:ParB family chromosome partitioning protein
MMAELRDAQQKVANGEMVVELDVALIDSSFVSDRINISDHPATADFIQSIRENGQQTPILVRPHPHVEGRYQVAYGHRRVHALRIIGRPVKAQIMALTDDELIIAQGQENRSRLDLSFIERCLFAKSLEEAKISRETICAAIRVDNPQLSRMLQVARGIPLDLVHAIGPAPSVGRRRWLEMVDALKALQWEDIQSGALSNATVETDSDERFNHVMLWLVGRSRHLSPPGSSVFSNGVDQRKAGADANSTRTPGRVPSERKIDGPPTASAESTHVSQPASSATSAQLEPFSIEQSTGEIRIVYNVDIFPVDQVEKWIEQIRRTAAALRKDTPAPEDSI